MLQKGFLLVMTFVFSTTACTVFQQDDVQPTDESDIEVHAYYGVNEELWPYFARFEAEALQRGIFVDLREAQITAEIEQIEDDGVAGKCRYSSHFPNHVTIDKAFWDSTSDLGREFVVFHELGHCDLGRDHRESTNADGTCKSLMRSGLNGCRDNYRSNTRAAYLDELFDPAFQNEIN